MKNLLLVYILTFFSVFSINSQETKKVLFIGNSYTARNGLVSIISNMAINTGDELIFDSYTQGGYRLMDHASNTTTLSKINSNDWDYVVLQAQSQETSWSDFQMERELYPFAQSLSNAIRSNNECSIPMFYMTWGRENGDASNCSVFSWVCTYEGMDDRIKETYNLMAETNEAKVTPAGAVWRFIRENYPGIDLYSNDGSHPSLAGSYAAACAFYTMIYKKDPTLMTWNSTLPEADANLIKAASKTVVFDQISSWDFTTNHPAADYSEVINANDVSFTNTSTDFDSLLWDFGDGITSTEINPMHSYSTNDDFRVSLTITKCGKSDTITKVLSLNSLGLEEFDTDRIVVFPNPVLHSLSINLRKNHNNIEFVILEITGKTLIRKAIKNKTVLDIDISNLNAGMYVLKIFADHNSYVSKVLKK